MCRISIVTPSFNQGSFIAETIESVLTQDDADLELLVMDGGSTDETLDILKQWARRDNRLSHVSEKDRGQAHAINKGFARATGDILAWLNSDDIYYPGALSSVRQAFEADPSVDVIYGEGDHLDREGEFLRRHPTEPFDRARLAESVILSQPSTFFRRRVVEQCGGLDENLHYALDYEYWIRLSREGMSFKYIPRVLSGIRMYEDAKTFKHRLAMHREVNDMLKARLGRVPEQWLLNYACVATGAEGRLRMTTPIRAAGILPMAIYAAFRWNGKVRPRSLMHWLDGLGNKAAKAIKRAA